MDVVLSILLLASFWATVWIATPLMFGSLGALICERAGALNFGIGGMLTAGTVAGWLPRHGAVEQRARSSTGGCETKPLGCRTRSGPRSCHSQLSRRSGWPHQYVQRQSRSVFCRKAGVHGSDDEGRERTVSSGSSRPTLRCGEGIMMRQISTHSRKCVRFSPTASAAART